MVWPYIALALGSVVGYELLKSWLESQSSQQQEMQVTPAMLIILILLAIFMLRR